MFITRIDSEKQERVVERGIVTREGGVKRLVLLAQQEAATLPNDPKIEVSGIDEVTVYIGLYRITTFRLESTHEEQISYVI